MARMRKKRTFLDERPSVSQRGQSVRCAVEIQHGMIERNSDLPPERRIEFRIGIYLGDVVEETSGDLTGDSVKIAVRTTATKASVYPVRLHPPTHLSTAAYTSRPTSLCSRRATRQARCWPVLWR
jgi:class 3 adenylate cyclase